MDDIRLALRQTDMLVYTIVPSFDVTDTTLIDPGLIQIAIVYGYMSAFDEIVGRTVSLWDHAVLSATSNVIAQARLYSWELENRAGFHGFDRRPRFHAGVLERIRELKRLVVAMTRTRIDRWGMESIIEDISNPTVGNVNVFEDWWRHWERHRPGTGPWINITSSSGFVRAGDPWAEHVDIFGNPVPAETPPTL